MHFTVNDWIGVIGFLVAIEMAIGHGTVSLTNAVPESWVPRVQAWCNILAFVGASLVTALSRIAAVMVVGVLVVGAAYAQDRNAGRPLTLPNPFHPPGQDQSGGAGGSSPLDKPFQDIANFIGDDIDAAITLATKIPSLQDGNGQQCLMAFKEFGEVIKAHPAPLTFKIASDLEAFRLKQMAINRLCSSDACSIVFSDITQTVTALSPVPLPVPNLHDLCSKVPTIKVAAPVTVPAPPVAPAPSAPAQIAPATTPNP